MSIVIFIGFLCLLFNIIISFRFAHSLFSLFCNTQKKKEKKNNNKKEIKESLCRVVYFMQGGLHTVKRMRKKNCYIKRMKKLSYKRCTINLWFQCCNLMDEAFFIASRIRIASYLQFTNNSFIDDIS